MECQSAAELKSAIYTAFSGTEYPGDTDIAYDRSGSNVEARQVAEYFKGRRWSDINLSVVLGYDKFADASACLSFMSPKAFQYFLPAFLLIVLENFDDSGLVASTTVSSLIPWRDPADRVMNEFVEKRLSGFSSQQREVIKMFLLHVYSVYPDEISAEEFSRALNFWK